MPSLLHAFIFLFYVVQNLFCGEARGHVAERGGLHAEVLLRRGGGGGEGGGGGGGVGGGGRGGGGRGGRRQGGASPALGGRRAEQRVEIQSPFQRGSARHGRLGRGREGESERPSPQRGDVAGGRPARAAAGGAHAGSVRRGRLLPPAGPRLGWLPREKTGPGSSRPSVRPSDRSIDRSPELRRLLPAPPRASDSHVRAFN